MAVRVRYCRIELICLSAAYADLQVCEMCASTVKSSERMKPKLRADEAKAMLDEQTWIEEGFGIVVKERDD